MRSLARFSVDNPVIVGVIMMAMLIGGGYSAATLVREMFPESRPNRIMITAPYPGATPSEIERGLALRIEEAVKDVDDLDKITSSVTEGLCIVTVVLTNDADDIDQAVNDVKAAIDTIPRDELPEEAEEIRVAKFEPRLPVISVTLFGDLDERALKAFGERLRDDLLRIEQITDVELGGTRKDELTVEVDPEKLTAFGLGISDVAAAVRAANLDLPGGQIKTRDQNISVRTLGESDDAARIAETVLLATPQGETIRISDVGRVIDTFEDDEGGGRFNGRAAVSCTVYKTGDQDAVAISDRVKAFVAGKTREPLELSLSSRARLLLTGHDALVEIHERAWDDPYPDSLSVMTHSNLAKFISDRLELLTRNGIVGLSLVFLSLLLFLNWRVAFWVMMGLVLAMCGAVMLMQFIGASLNLISMFGLIVVLGLIVDDAIVVGENIYARVERGEDPHVAAVVGTQEVTWPVIVAVTTTMGAFAPLLLLQGQIGDFMRVLPVVVICALGVSLFEALSILPSHLAEWLKPQAQERAERQNSPMRRWIAKFRGSEHHILLSFINRRYIALLNLAVRYRYVTLAAATAALLLAFGLIAGGRVKVVFFQKMDAETVLVSLDMPVGTPIAQTQAAMRQIEDAALENPDTRTVWAVFGAQVTADETGAYTTFRSHLAQAIIELKPVEERDRNSEAIVNEMRSKVGQIAGANSIRFGAMQGGPAGREIEIQITGPQIEPILHARDELMAALEHIEGTYDLGDDHEAGQREMQIELLDSARALGFTTRYLATEVRGAFFGLEARTLQRGREDVDIVVRFPEDRRKHVYELANLRVKAPNGALVPFSEVARVREDEGVSAIQRVNQRRAVTVLGDVDQAVTTSEEVLASLAPLVEKLESTLPGVRINYAGNAEQFRKTFGSLKVAYPTALLLIYFMLAALFKSYLQPLVVLAAVPFGLTGAIVGHYISGYQMTILSMIGVVALTGIVVNDSLIMVDFINHEMRAGIDKLQAVLDAGQRRLRPILLTSATTVLGLAPLMLEASFQAKFMIPMAVSISYGLIFATVLTLIVIPANYMILLDFYAFARRVWHGPATEPAPTPV